MKLKIILLSTLVGTFIGTSTAWGALGARAVMMSKSGSDVKGSVEFKELDNGDMKVTYNLRNLPKNQTVGVHVHEVGDCTARDAKSAGGHFAHIHSQGGTSADFPSHYAGDLPQVTSDGQGKARGSYVVSNLSINGSNAINKLAVVVHGGPDNVNAPAAPRIACGIIEGPQVAPRHTSGSTTTTY